MNTTTRTTQSVSWQVASVEIDYQYGRHLFAVGEPLGRCANDNQRWGWRNAYRAEVRRNCGIVDGINMLTGEVYE